MGVNRLDLDYHEPIARTIATKVCMKVAQENNQEEALWELLRRVRMLRKVGG